jgi:shikimate dehydrogenase
MIINATSLGLKKEDRINIDFPSSTKNKFFYDVIYNPKETNFLKTGKSLGNKTLNGEVNVYLSSYFRPLISGTD